MDENVQETLDAIRAAEQGGDVLALLDQIPNIPLEGHHVTVPDDWPRALHEKVRILRELQDLAGDAGPAVGRRKPKYAVVHTKKETWVMALEILQAEVNDLIEIYIETTQKAGESVDLVFVNEVRGQLADKLGTLGCEYLIAYYKGWKLKPEEKKRLTAAWNLIGRFIAKLMHHAD